MTAGPLLAGVLVASLGFGWTYTIDVVSVTFALWGLLKLPPLAGGGTRLLSEGWVLLLGGVLCAVLAWLSTKWQPGFVKYDSRNPLP